MRSTRDGGDCGGRATPATLTDPWGTQSKTHNAIWPNPKIQWAPSVRSVGGSLGSSPKGSKPYKYNGLGRFALMLFNISQICLYVFQVLANTDLTIYMVWRKLTL